MELYHSPALSDNTQLIREVIFLRTLREADLTGAKLREATLDEANLTKAIISGAVVGSTSFGDVDLSETKGLDQVKHEFPSPISIGTIYKSKGNIPEVFLRGCGVPENFIAFMHSLTEKAFDFYSCFMGATLELCSEKCREIKAFCELRSFRKAKLATIPIAQVQFRSGFWAFRTSVLTV